MSDIEQKNEPIMQPIVEKVSDMQANNEPVPLEKPKKPRTEKQIEAFKRTQQKRSENIALKKSQPKQVIQPVSVPVPVVQPIVQPVSVAEPDDDFSDSDSEEEIVVRRKPKKDKVVKKKKQIVIELSDSESDSDESVEQIKAPSKVKAKFESQQHKKYSKSNANVDKKNFFCD